MKKIALAIILLMFCADFADAQSFYSRRRNRTLMFSAGIGATTYHGDLHDIFFDGFTARPNIGIGLRKQLGSQLNLRFDLNWYQIEGSDEKNQELNERENRNGGADSRRPRNLSFRASNFEASLSLLFNLIPVNGSYARRPLINPYIMFGIGLSGNNPKALFEGEWIALRPLQTELVSYSGTLLVVPLGIGVRLKANQYVDVLLEAGRRFTFTDYLDDVSTEHVDHARFDDLFGAGSENARLASALSDRSAEGGFVAAAPGDDRGNPDKNDAYYIFQIRLEIYLPDNFINSLFSPSRRKPKFR